LAHDRLEADLLELVGDERREVDVDREVAGDESGVSIASTLSYQSLRGLRRSLAGASRASRTTSKVYFTSFALKGWPSCQRTLRRRKKTRFP